jgi:hypothetical protein
MSQHVTRLCSLDETTYTNAALAVFLNSPAGRRQLIAGGAGSTRLELTHESLGAIELPRIPPSVLEEISEHTWCFVSRYTALIADIAHLVEEADQLFGADTQSSKNGASIFSIDRSALKDNWTLSRYADAGNHFIERVQREWEWVYLADLYDIERGKGNRVKQYAAAGLPFIRTSSLINYSVDPYPDHCATAEVYDSFRQPIQDGDILYSIEGKIGPCALLSATLPLVFKNHIQRLQLRSKAEGFSRQALVGWTFLVLSGRVGKRQAALHAVVQSTIPGLGSRLGTYVVPLTHRGTTGDPKQQAELGKLAYDKSVELVSLIAQFRQETTTAYSRLAELFE